MGDILRNDFDMMLLITLPLIHTHSYKKVKLGKYTSRQSASLIGRSKIIFLGTS